MKFYLALLISKLSYLGLKMLRRPATSFAGFIALKICPDFLKYCQKFVRKAFINVTGTNGKTTTSGILAHIFQQKNSVIHNTKGANMLSGIANIFAVNICPLKKYDYAVIETDEAFLTKVYNFVKADYLLVTNLFPDQLDRYGDIDFTAQVIQEAIDKNKDLKLVLNADDSGVCKFGENRSAVYFGFNKECDYRANVSMKQEYFELTVKGEVFKVNLIGEYNAYNALGAIVVALENGFSAEEIQSALDIYKPAFGRAEKRRIDGRDVIIQLIKNPTGLTEVLKTLDVNSNVIIAMNDDFADGRDVSWLWDVNFEKCKNINNRIVVSGTRAYSIATRLKYAGISVDKIIVEPDIKKALKLVVKNVPKGDKITILPSYTALLKISKY